MIIRILLGCCYVAYAYPIVWYTTKGYMRHIINIQNKLGSVHTKLLTVKHVISIDIQIL